MSQNTSIYRSRSQLLTSYCPGTFFAFEGGIGSYKVYPGPVPEADISRETADQILERIQEAATSWLNRTRQLREADSNRPVPPELCIDDILLNMEGNGIRSDLPSKLTLVTPQLMNYQPEPWTMVCTPCNLVKDYTSLSDMYKNLSLLQGEKCIHPQGPKACGFENNERLPCTWRQLDVVFVHQSGTAVGATPRRYNWSPDKEEVVLSYYTCICGCKDVILKKDSFRIGLWYFACASCGNTDKRWLQNDPFTMKKIRGHSGDRTKEIRMEPDSFRSSRVTYPQTDRIIDFSGRNILKLIGNTQELIKTLAEKFDYPRQELSLNEIEKAVGSYPEEAKELEKYKQNIKFIEEYKNNENIPSEVIETTQDNCNKIYREWVEKGYIRPRYDIPEGIYESMNHEGNIPSKYDPFRLFAEHLALEEEIINGGDMGGGKRHFVPFNSPDKDLEHEPFKGHEEEINKLLGQMGIAQMGLIRKFKLCFFSYGFTRMHPRPILTNSHDIEVPVRLNLFDKIQIHESRKNPVYVLKQENEAIYVKLNQEVVRQFILNLSCENGECFRSGPLGSRILENMFPMDMYLDNVRGRGPFPHPYLVVYSLLHTMAHHIIHAVAEYSGLDLGSLGEYLFPADLAFVIYRNGMTMDLGNLSAMWRNQGRYFLEHLLQPKSLSCGLGMLCENRGGSCPDCIMVPETTCIAQNRLLSRSILKGGPKPWEGGFTDPIDGYFDIANQMGES